MFQVKGQAAGGLMCLALQTKMAIIEAGALHPLVEVAGGACLEAVLDLVKGVDPSGDGGDTEDLASALARMSVSDAGCAARADEVTNADGEPLLSCSTAGKLDSSPDCLRPRAIGP